MGAQVCTGVTAEIGSPTAVTCESLQRMDSRTWPMDTRAAVPRGLPNAPRMPVCRCTSNPGQVARADSMKLVHSSHWPSCELLHS
jgi:hypothetical protein